MCMMGQIVSAPSSPPPKDAAQITGKLSQTHSPPTRSLVWVPLLLAVSFGASLWLGYLSIEQQWRDRVASELESVLVREVAALEAATTYAPSAGFGTGGDTIIFDSEGRVISSGRGSTAPSFALRNPGGDTTIGFTSKRPVERQPLTAMASKALAGQSGINLDGYRNSAGVPVVGAWRWLPQLNRGVAAELPMIEAYKGIHSIYFVVLVTLAFLGSVASGSLTYGRVVKARNRQLRRAQRLGQYTLVSKIGEGGMGVVYVAKHVLLQRPTAIKLLSAANASENQIARFEREVQLTTRLSHPNTITIFDYGRTRDGTFYYVMELLDGASLAAIVDAVGKLHPARAVRTLMQVASALEEAHSSGLIHRDIKPGNIMLCNHGGKPDVAKLLDFGLVKDTAESNVHLTVDGSLTGTPLYLAPETITSGDADARSDIYSLGAVAYFLLTGEAVFDGFTLVETCGHHIHTVPPPPSERLGESLPEGLDQFVLDCLEKDPARRPQSASEVIARLSSCSTAEVWGEVEARQWWGEHGATLSPPKDGGSERPLTVNVHPKLPASKTGARRAEAVG